MSRFSLMKESIRRNCIYLNLVLIILLLMGCSPQEGSKKRYNVLFIAVDDLRPELGCYGKDYISSPNIDRLASEGRIFNHAYCQQALCAPSRASLLTGRYPDQLGVMNLKDHFRDNFPDLVTLPQLFKENGYFSYGIGKIFHSPTNYDPASWSENQPVLKGSNYCLKRNDENYASTVEMVLTDTADYFDRNTTLMAIKKLEELKDSTFFLAVGLFKPHLPFNAPESFWKRYDQNTISLPETEGDPIGAPSYSIRGWWEIQNYADMPTKEEGITEDKARELIHGYRACISYTDNHVGMLLDGLKRLGLEENTIVVLWGDHGYKLYDYQDWCKHTLTEIDNRVPLIMKVPGMPNQGSSTEAIVELIDIYPTLADICSLPRSETLDGKSFKEALMDPKAKHREVALSMYPRRHDLLGYSVRSEDFRYTKWSMKDDFSKYDSLELYDLKNDPHASVNRAYDTEYASDIKALDQLLNTTVQGRRNKVYPIK